MNTEILINVTPMETRVGLVENGMLQEVYIERSQNRGIVGNIYKGKVVRVLPGMQAAFVDAGLERAAFIHAADIAPALTDTEAKDRPPAQIHQLVQENQSLVVQVVKDPISTKGARLTTQITIPSRYLVYMPNNAHVGVSQRIEEEDERQRLKRLVEQQMEQVGIEDREGFILRTVAEGAGEEEIASDIRYLRRLWNQVRQRMQAEQVPASIYEELPLYLRVMRDLVRFGNETIRVDSRETYQRMNDFAEQFVPELADCLHYYPGERPIFDLYSVEDELHKALDPKVQLKSGGYLIIDQTEAMTTIDVNTGGFVGHRNLEETVFKTNLEAALAIGRQLRLRNLGGIIIIDFIDMQEPEHRRQVLRMLEKALEKDHAKTTISAVTELGLVEMTRKRTRESLGQMLCEPCPVCAGRGLMKTSQTVCYEIFRDILRNARAYDAGAFLVLASQAVVDLLISDESANVADLEAFIGKPIKFQVEPIYNQEQFDVVLQ